MAFDWFSLVPAVTAVITSGINAIGGSDANDDAARRATQGSQEAADILSAGYTEAERRTLEALGLGSDLSTERFSTLADIYPQISDRFAATQANTYDDFGDIVDTGQAEGEADILRGAGDFDLLAQQGLEGANETLAPYRMAGDEALSSLREISGADPSIMTPAQLQRLADLKRSGATRLAAGGLRGAGRAGVAVMNDIEGREMARSFDQNLARSDRALGTLSGQGYGATGTTAGNILNVNTIRGKNALATGQSLAELGDRSATRKAGALMQTGQNIANRDLATDQFLGTEAGNYYDRIARLQAAGGDTRAATIMAKANAQAGAKTTAGNLAAQNALANARLRSGAFSTLGSVIADEGRRRSSAAPAYTPMNWGDNVSAADDSYDANINWN